MVVARASWENALNAEAWQNVKNDIDRAWRKTHESPEAQYDWQKIRKTRRRIRLRTSGPESSTPDNIKNGSSEIFVLGIGDLAPFLRDPNIIGSWGSRLENWASEFLFSCGWAPHFQNQAWGVQPCSSNPKLKNDGRRCVFSNFRNQASGFQPPTIEPWRASRSNPRTLVRFRSKSSKPDAPRVRKLEPWCAPGPNLRSPVRLRHQILAPRHAPGPNLQTLVRPRPESSSPTLVRPRPESSSPGEHRAQILEPRGRPSPETTNPNRKIGSTTAKP